jgi:hypothetical protein
MCIVARLSQIQHERANGMLQRGQTVAVVARTFGCNNLQVGRRVTRNHNPRTLTAIRLAFIQELGLFPWNLV